MARSQSFLNRFLPIMTAIKAKRPARDAANSSASPPSSGVPVGSLRGAFTQVYCSGQAEIRGEERGVSEKRQQMRL